MEASTSTIRSVVLPDANNGAASMLVVTVAHLMAVYLEAGQLFDDPSRFRDLCCSLAKGIDYAIANDEVPIRSRDLPPLLRQVYRSRGNESFLIGLMMLTMSVQCACKLDWFLKKDTHDLLKIAEEVMEKFADPEYIRIEPTHAFCWVSHIISRCYPSMKIEGVIFSAEFQPGFRYCVASFPIIRATMSPKHDKICLIVVQVDGFKAPSFIIDPPDLNILLNGQEVQGKAVFSIPNRCQIPMDVTAMLKSGVNYLQAFGEFDGNFLIALAVINNGEGSNSLGMQSYARPPYASTASGGSSATIQATGNTVHQAMQLNLTMADRETNRYNNQDLQQVETHEDNRSSRRMRGSRAGDQAYDHAFHQFI